MVKMTSELAAVVEDARKAFVAEAAANRVLEPATKDDVWTAAAKMLRELVGTDIELAVHDDGWWLGEEPVR